MIFRGDKKSSRENEDIAVAGVMINNVCVGSGDAGSPLFGSGGSAGSSRSRFTGKMRDAEKFMEDGQRFNRRGAFCEPRTERRSIGTRFEKAQSQGDRELGGGAYAQLHVN